MTIPGADDAHEVWRIGDLELDVGQQRLWRDGTRDRAAQAVVRPAARAGAPRPRRRHLRRADGASLARSRRQPRDHRPARAPAAQLDRRRRQRATLRRGPSQPGLSTGRGRGTYHQGRAGIAVAAGRGFRAVARAPFRGDASGPATDRDGAWRRAAGRPRVRIRVIGSATRPGDDRATPAIAPPPLGRHRDPRGPGAWGRAVCFPPGAVGVSARAWCGTGHRRDRAGSRPLRARSARSPCCRSRT